MRIEKKAWPEFFQKVLEGIKTYDLRLADFDCRPGDILLLKEWDPEKRSYTGRVIEKEITYVSKTRDQKFFSKEDADKLGYIIMSFK